MTFYNRDSEGDYTRAPDTTFSRVDKIEPGIYELRVPLMGSPFLHRIADRKPIPPKIYGDAESLSDRIIKTYVDRRDKGLNTGILLEGIKGSGKSLTSSISINKVIDAGGYCITVNKPYPGELLKDIIGTPAQPVVLDFDEFEKIYKADSLSISDLARSMSGDRDTLVENIRRAGVPSRQAPNPAQESLLTFLSGGTTAGVLSIITVNDSSNINEFMRKRPSRIFYNVKYNGLSPDVIEAFSKDVLEDQKLIPEFVRKTSRIHNVSFDIITSIADDINRMKLGVTDSMAIMGFGAEAWERFRTIVLYRGKNVTGMFDGNDEFVSDKGGDYPYDIRSDLKDAIEEYFNMKKDPSVEKKELTATRRRIFLGDMLSDDELESIPKHFVASRDVFGDGVMLHDSGVYAVPTCSTFKDDVPDDYLNDLIVLAADTAINPAMVYSILQALNVSGKLPVEEASDAEFSFGKSAENMLAHVKKQGLEVKAVQPAIPVVPVMASLPQDV